MDVATDSINDVLVDVVVVLDALRMMVVIVLVDEIVLVTVSSCTTVDVVLVKLGTVPSTTTPCVLVLAKIVESWNVSVTEEVRSEKPR